MTSGETILMHVMRNKSVSSRQSVSGSSFEILKTRDGTVRRPITFPTVRHFDVQLRKTIEREAVVGYMRSAYDVGFIWMY